VQKLKQGGRLAGKVAIVTGGSRGIGRAIAEGYAAEGAKVVVASRQREHAEAAVEAIRAAGGEALAHQIDVADAAQAPGLVQAALDRFGGLDVMVCNAGVNRAKPVLELTEDDWDWVLNINLRGAFFCAQAAAKVMAKHGNGAIILVSSQLVGSPRRKVAHYLASKAGMWGLAQAMALDLGPFGVRVNALMPGVTETDINRARLADPAERAADAGRTALGRVGQPQEMVGAAIFLASDEAAYVTGASIKVDGGWPG
jgi:3-oxoacyl-[acyl-carrier protein] reductase